LSNAPHRNPASLAILMVSITKAQENALLKEELQAFLHSFESC
jgi:hypothetical protein